MFRQGSWPRWWWLAALLVFDAAFALWWFGRGCGREDELSLPGVPVDSLPPDALPTAPVVLPLRIGFPTAQTNLTSTADPAVFMPTASGRVESALYGSVRTQNAGGRILPSFHEGVDIAPLRRDRRGRAQDPVLAVADGTVAYANRGSGNSNYGIYVVLEHADPVGVIYTLYAHLSAVEKRIRTGERVRCGDVLGVMGNTPSSITPVARAHLHFEIGMIRNRRFANWAAAQKLDNRHGGFNGWNLTGIDPLTPYGTTEPERLFSMLDTLDGLPAAFELLIVAARPLDYFVRYPSLWRGEGPARGELVLTVSEGGVVMRGRPATDEERGLLSGRAVPVVRMADPAVLGRNGLRLVSERGGRWELGAAGRKWLEILTY
jgi:murein DD-endopeptidase MepM/ murein hydrolase activator NlpD